MKEENRQQQTISGQPWVVCSICVTIRGVFAPEIYHRGAVSGELLLNLCHNQLCRRESSPDCPGHTQLARRPEELIR